jgi:ABC-type phosphate transport system substrate-binding protein
MRIPLAAAIAALAVLAQVAAAPQEPRAELPALAIIVHPSNPVADLSEQRLRAYFLFETQTWPHGRKVTVVLREKGQPERTEAIRLVCGMSEPDYERHLLFQSFKGELGPGPRSIRTAASMIRFVFNVPGAIGYVYADEVDPSIKVLRINGRLPGDPNYPLRRSVRGTPAKVPAG